jgi:hypothetical protein
MRRNITLIAGLTLAIADKVTTYPGVAAAPVAVSTSLQPSATIAATKDEDPVVAVRRTKSFEGTRPLGKEIRRRTRLLEASLLQKCVSLKGVTFDGLLQPNVDEGAGDHTFWLPIPTVADAQQNGFHPREDLSGGTIRPTDPKLLQALEGDDKLDKGCRATVGEQLVGLGIEADRKLYASLVTTFQNRQSELIAVDSLRSSVTTAWKVCMISEGISDTTERRDLLRKYLSVATLGDHERVAAVADAKCSAASGLNDLLMRASEQAAVSVAQDQATNIRALNDADKALLLTLPSQ